MSARHAGAIWIVCGFLAAAPGARAQRVDAAAAAAAYPLDFDIPPQPLALALDQYAAVSGRSVMVRDALAGGRVSSPVRGRYTPQAALEALLDGTGLAAEAVSGQPDAFILKPAAPAPAVAAPSIAPDRAYDAMVQARVWQALCADPRSAPGAYRAILRFHLDAAGHVRQPRLLSSSGDARRDTALLAALAAARMDSPPVAGLAQPLTLVVLPRGAVAGQSCQEAH